MRRFFLASLIAFLGVALRAQTAPDIARDTTAETVIRLYGWPRGKSTTEGRESWMYDHFQVLFENGRVVSVSPLLQGKKSTRSPLAPVRTPAAQPNRPMPPAANSARKLPTANSASRPGSPAATSTTPRPTATAAKRDTAGAMGLSAWTTLGWAAGATLAVGIGGLLFAKWSERARVREAERESAAEWTSPTERARKTWQDTVAEQLAGQAGDRRPDSARVENAVVGPDLTPTLLRRLEWKRFEQVVALYFAATGVRAECTCIGPDGGVDVKLFRADSAQPFSYVQCKAWGSEKVPVTKLREFLGVMAADKITEGVFITTSDFWPDARTFAEANGIAALTTADFVEKFQALPPETRTRILATVTTGDYTTPTCPQCDSKMVWKPRASYWACPKFPRCRSKPIWPRLV